MISIFLILLMATDRMNYHATLKDWDDCQPDSEWEWQFKGFTGTIYYV